MDVRGKSDEERRRRVMEAKLSTPLDELCRGHPVEFGTYISYCRSLRFEGKPDYDYCRKLFADVFLRRGYERDAQFDWVAPPELKEGTSLARACQRLVAPNSARNAVLVF